ncbi:hypothetical protein [Pectinatus frisingensis]|uniref:hypothetical protein n=1 Tax=Pectinatus frisingensis TaxID=865 RepID=UPI0018C47F34|nr:hypothetical protein [Pectinatus frisingensis]
MTFFLGILSGIIISFINSLVRNCLEKKRLASAITSEITALMKQYGKIGGSLKRNNPDGTCTLFTTKIDDDFFTIYNKNADKLGYFSPLVIKKIVELYTNAKGFVCSIKTWNDMVENKFPDNKVSIDEINRYYECLKYQRDGIFTDAMNLTNELNVLYCNRRFKCYWNLLIK